MHIKYLDLVRGGRRSGRLRGLGRGRRGRSELPRVAVAAAAAAVALVAVGGVGETEEGLLGRAPRRRRFLGRSAPSHH